MSLSLRVRLSGLQDVDRILKRISELQMSDMLDAVGSEVVAQTQLRIQFEKTDPAGDDWDEWSPKYAATRHSGHSLLMNEGDLLESIQHVVNGNDLEVGSNRPYAKDQNFGDPLKNLPARQFLGLSAENRDDVILVIRDWLEGQLS